MLNKQKYSDYLTKKKTNEKLTGERLWLFDEFQKSIDKIESNGSSDFTIGIVEDFIKKQSWSYGTLDKAFSFLSEYSAFIKKEQPELSFISDNINECCLKIFEAKAKDSATKRKEVMRLIPDDVKINPKHLNGIANNQFIKCFRELQQLILSIYSDIEEKPFEWGYPDTHVTGDAANNRMSVFFLNLFVFSKYANDVLTVKYFDLKTHKKIEMIFDKLTDLGFVFEGYDKKAESFTVSYSKNPSVLKVANIYANSQDFLSPMTSSGNTRFESFSYRWVEDPVEQKYEPIFHVKMDMSLEQTQDIQDWLHEKADEYGYKIDMKKPFDKDCVYYQKGSKEFIHVGERVFGHEDRTIGSNIGSLETYTKVILRDVFSSHPDKISALGKRFPGVFGKGNSSPCTRCGGRKKADDSCSMRIAYDYDGDTYENCAYQSFYFKNLTLDSFKNIFELFLIEKKIK